MYRLSFFLVSFKKGELVVGTSRFLFQWFVFGVSEVLFCFVLLSRASTRSGSVELLLVCVLAPLGASSVSLVGFGVLFWVQMNCCCDASLLWLDGSSTSFWVEFCFLGSVLFCRVLVTLVQVRFRCLKSLTTSSRLVWFVR